jgi:hypothetical protein
MVGSGPRRSITLKSWVRRWLGKSPARRRTRALPLIQSAGTLVAGKYEALYQYLEKRYASSVVLTFAQIEDLLGFPLADSARVDPDWWSNDDPRDPRLAQSMAWTRASRMATVNLGAQTVLFERIQV